MGSYSAANEVNWVMAAIAGTLSATVTSMGLGGGGILIIYFSLFTNIPQSLAQGINLLFFIPSAIVATIIYARKKLINFRLAIRFSAFGILGALLGAYLAYFIDSKILSKLFALLLFVMGVMQFRGRGKNK